MGAIHVPLRVKYEIIKKLRDAHSIRFLCHSADVSSSSYYAWKSRAPKRQEKQKEDERVVALIRTTCKKYLGKWGSKQVTMQISTPESPINHKRVARIMREHNLLSKRRRANPYKHIPKNGDDIEIAENLVNRQYAYTLLWPWRVFGTDLTFIRFNGGWAYLSVIKDFCTGEIIAHVLSLKPNTELVQKTLDIFALRVPLEDRLGGILHSDRGSVYTSKIRCNRTRELGLLVSMSRKGNCIDNAPTESFFGHMKDDLQNTNVMSFEDLRDAIDTYILEYNTVRKQWHRNKMTPVDYRNYLFGVDSRSLLFNVSTLRGAVQTHYCFRAVASWS